LKSNASYLAIGKAQELVRKTGDLPVPLHLRNAPTKLMKDLNYGKEYRYAHDYDNNFSHRGIFTGIYLRNNSLRTTKQPF